MMKLKTKKYKIKGSIKKMKNKTNKGWIRRHNIWEIIIKGVNWKQTKI
jgi:hypothetical protein